jgi:2-polyprenyl-6-methoxyphenol hydroxylase-like FAD-dependent oxidoreductase
MKALVIGGGIGGLATALCLHRAGIEAQVFEQSRAVRELGVGINTLPHAIKELAGLGLLDALDRVGIRTYELLYQNCSGQTIWREPRGTDAGYDFPQFSIHRGRLQGVLYEAVKERLGESAVHTDHRLTGFVQSDNGVAASFTRREGDDVEVTGDLMIAADGIHSCVRNRFFPDEGSPLWNGIMLWRGAVEHAPFMTGRSMIIAGGMAAKFVLYPISNETSTPGTQLVNWAVAKKLSDGVAPPPRHEDWNREGDLDELLAHIRGVFHLEVLDAEELIRSTETFYEYPMCDRDPLKQWSHGRVTLLGDAAHPMYPVGSNGASQAVLDAVALERHLSAGGPVETALEAYDTERRPATADIVRQNRSGGPERVIDVIEARAPEGFDNIEDVASCEEREAIVRGYASLAGYAVKQVNVRR